MGTLTNPVEVWNPPKRWEAETQTLRILLDCERYLECNCAVLPKSFCYEDVVAVSESSFLQFPSGSHRSIRRHRKLPKTRLSDFETTQFHKYILLADLLKVRNNNTRVKEFARGSTAELWP